MRIVLLGRYNKSDFLNGPERVANSLYTELNKYNLDISFVEYFFEGSKYALFQKIFGNDSYTDDKITIIRKGILPVLLFLFKSKPDIIHIVTFERFAFLAFIYKLFHKCSIVYNVHGIIVYENSVLQKNMKKFHKWKDHFVEKIIFKYSDCLIFLSQRSIELAGRYYKAAPKKNVIIPNGFDAGIICYQHPAVEMCKELKAVFVGSSSRPEKGLDFLIDSIKEVNIPIKLFVIGDRESSIAYNNIVKIIYIKKMSNSGFIKFLSDKHVYISAGFYEQFSISALEAMALGLVIILTVETGLSERLSDGEEGFIIRYGDRNQLKNIIQKIYNDKSVIDRLTKKSKIIAKSFTWTNIIKNFYLPLYANICKTDEIINPNK